MAISYDPTKPGHISLADLGSHIREHQKYKEMQAKLEGERYYTPARYASADTPLGIGAGVLGRALSHYRPNLSAEEGDKLKARIRELEIQLSERDEIIEALVADLDALQEKIPEQPVADKDGWIKWDAPKLATGDSPTPPPVTGNPRLEVMLRYYKDTAMRNIQRAAEFTWEECGSVTITAYRHVV